MKRRRFLAAAVAGGTLGLGGLARAARRWQIAAVTYRGRTAVEDGFEAYLAARRIPVDIQWFDLARDPDRLPAIVAAIRRLRPDLVYAWGTTVTLGLVGPFDAVDPVRHLTDVPVVFTLVADPVGARLVPSLVGSGRALTGVSHMAPVATQLRAMADYRPFRRIGVIYSPTEANSRLVVEQISGFGADLGFVLLERPFPLNDAGRPDAGSALAMIEALKKDGADWLYLPPDSYLTTQAARLLAHAAAVGLPSFASTEALIKSGALAGIVSRYQSVGQFTAYKAEQILVEGRSAAAIPIETLSRFSLQVNVPVARAMNLPPPLAMFDYAELIDEVSR